ncbi:Exopolysaccharide biosynthesis protein YbjH [Insolitispirillum peregrinum]|uniref:Exopolysaccharide biosynthesis protein YbjH n=2 Tax=Insolitispirillum peregrinum TaxID=80876 RepID=A0A1N7JDD4_9PROT|nr:Exopolysaccharide biosynthesis protein YbjH [Insolitispirillum peregrinum]
MVRLRATLFLSCAVSALLASLQGGYARAEDVGRGAFSPSLNDYGTTGLLQMPNGRMGRDGDFSLGFSTSSPYTRFFLTSQILPWLQGTFRYTDISYASYGIVDTQSYKDKSVDVKIRLLQEGPSTPEVSLGFRDVGGTGVFSSEYLAASRRYYGFDFTGGISWGNMGSRGHLPNPFGVISDRMKVRPDGTAAGNVSTGTLSTSFFQGENIGLFGGVEWQTPVDGLRLKVEYDSNNYQNEFQGKALKVTSPINAAIGYRVLPWLDLSLGYERGNTVMFRGAMVSNFNEDMGVPKLDEKAPLPVTGAQKAAPPTLPNQDMLNTSVVGASVDTLFDTMQQHGVVAQSVDLSSPVMTIHLDKTSSTRAEDLAAVGLTVAQMPTVSGIEKVVFRASDGSTLSTMDANRLLQQQASLGGTAPVPEPSAADTDVAGRLFKALDYYGFTGRRVAIKGNRITVVYSQGKFSKLPSAFGRVARAVALTTPPSVSEFDLIEENAGIPVGRVVFQRDDVIAAATSQKSIDELWLNSETPSPEVPQDLAWNDNKDIYPAVSWGLSPNLRQNIGGPNNFYMYQLYANATADVHLTHNLSVSGSVGGNIYNNYADFTYDAPSNLPRVRTDLRSYLISSDVWLDSLHADYITQLAPDWYGRGSVGIFELMYAGVDGEVLYRPVGKRWAVGLDVNHVWQRDFNGGFGLKDYDVTTGHLTWYHQLPFDNMTAALSLGRYLAKDVGATLAIGRRFDNGITLGAWATKTDISAETFGEGSFDKGFYVTIPFGLFSTENTKNRGTFSFRPLTRDGGARVALPIELYAVTGPGDASTDGWQDSMK